MSDANEALSARGLAVGFQGRPVVSDIDITLYQGQSIALVGTNGSGKSTLLKTIVGLLAPVAGTVRTLGAEPGTQPKRVGYLGQFHPAGGLLPMQARDVVMMGRYPRRGLLGRIRSSDREVVMSSMERMGVADLASHPLRALSGGQQQRVYLAQTLAREADFLILDEPTAGLDAGSSERYLQVVQEELARGAAVATATHDISEALLCDQAILLARRVIAYGVPSEVLNAERIMDAFGIALRAVPHQGHEDLVAPETPHGHHIDF
jgi:ABC-type Mn2+/Zn2+ transport system ATPase subunit